MTWTLFGILIYVAAQLGIGLWVSRKIHTEADYLLAGRSFGYGLAIFSIFATWFGAETCIGAAGAMYERGLKGSSADPFGYGLCLLFMGLVFAIPLWRRKLTTLADLFRQRWSPGVERLGVLIMVPTSLLWAAAQIRALGHVLAASSELSASIGMMIAAAVVIIYTTSGGLLADAYNDLIQGIALILGLVVTFVTIAVALGGVEATFAVVPAEKWTLLDGEIPFYVTLDTWLVPICGSVVAQELIARILASRSPQVAQRSTLIAAGGYTLIGLIPAFLGLVAAATLPGLEDPEQALPLLAQRHLHGVVYVLFAGALIAAILSTVDSALLVAGSLVSHNLLSSQISDRSKLLAARVCVVISGLIAYVLATHAGTVFELVEGASSFGSAGIFVLLIFGLFSRWGGSSAAYATLITGTVTWLFGTYVAEWSAPYLIALAASFAVYLSVGLLDRSLQTSQAT